VTAVKPLAVSLVTSFRGFLAVTTSGASTRSLLLSLGFPRYFLSDHLSPVSSRESHNMWCFFLLLPYLSLFTEDGKRFTDKRSRMKYYIHISSRTVYRARVGDTIAQVFVNHHERWIDWMSLTGEAEFLEYECVCCFDVVEVLEWLTDRGYWSTWLCSFCRSL
jgi:hypothetical protein